MKEWIWRGNRETHTHRPNHTTDGNWRIHRQLVVESIFIYLLVCVCLGNFFPTAVIRREVKKKTKIGDEESNIQHFKTVVHWPCSNKKTVFFLSRQPTNFQTIWHEYLMCECVHSMVLNDFDFYYLILSTKILRFANHIHTLCLPDTHVRVRLFASNECLSM